MSINRGRVRWQCRQGSARARSRVHALPERHFDRLTDDQLADLDDLLRCDDYDIWAMVNGSKACEVDRWKEMVGLLRQT